DIEYALSMDGDTLYAPVIINPIGMLGKKIYFCTHFPTQIDYSLVDMAGRKIQLINGKFAPGAYISQLPMPSLKPGLYIFRLIAKSEEYENGFYEKTVKVFKSNK
ncbi:MAG: hypothetical protein ACXWDO_06085, partial [Bacteroidia bacterium]